MNGNYIDTADKLNLMEKEKTKTNEKRYNIKWLWVSLFLAVVIYSVVVGICIKFTNPGVKIIIEETFWTDENIQFWSRINVPPPFDKNDETALRIYYEMNYLKEAAQLREMKCVPLLYGFYVEEILMEKILLLQQQQHSKRERRRNNNNNNNNTNVMVNKLLKVLLVPDQKIFVNRCMGDNRVFCNGVDGTKCLPLKDVRQGITRICLAVKNETLVDKRMEEEIIKTALNGTFCREKAIISFNVEEHVHCSCQCPCSS